MLEHSRNNFEATETKADVLGSLHLEDPRGEEMELMSSGVEEPSPLLPHEVVSYPQNAAVYKIQDKDVLLGRGRPFHNHPGNVVFRNLIHSRIDEFETANKARKTEITKEVMEMVKESSGRFLKPASDRTKVTPLNCSEWEHLDDHAARLKVAFTFRSVRKALRQP